MSDEQQSTEQHNSSASEHDEHTSKAVVSPEVQALLDERDAIQAKLTEARKRAAREESQRPTLYRLAFAELVERARRDSEQGDGRTAELVEWAMSAAKPKADAETAARAERAKEAREQRKSKSKSNT